MSSTPQTFTLLQDLNSGHYIADSEVPTGYTRVPDRLVQTNPYQFVIDWYELYLETGSVKMDFPVGSVGHLYVALLGSGISRTELTTGVSIAFTTTGTSPDEKLNRLTVTIDDDTFPAAFVCDSTMRLIFEAEDGSGNILATAFIDVQLVDDKGEYSGDFTVSTADEAVSSTEITSDTTLTSVPGPRTLLIDASAAAVTVTLPASDDEAAQDLTLIAVNVDHTVTVQLPGVEVFGGTAETSFTIDSVNSAHRLLAHYDSIGGTSSWYHLNYVEALE